MNNELAISGGEPAFKQLIQGQQLLPSWDQFENLIDGIFERRYYTNHGPLALEFERKFRDFFGAKNALYMTNSGIAVMITTLALDLRKKVIIPAFSHVSLAQALVWAGAQPVYCDVNRETLHLDPDQLEMMIDKDTCAILGANLFGGSCDYEVIERIAQKHSIITYYLSDDSIGQQFRNKQIGNFGKLEIFSLHESKIINAVNGCVVTCNDDQLAEKIRHIRSSYGLGKPTPVAFTGNGRMSEIVAGMALLGLEKFGLHVKENKKIAEGYEKMIMGIWGLEMYKPGSEISSGNFHRIIVRVNENEFGISAPELCKVLKAEGFSSSIMDNYSRNIKPPFEQLSGFPNALELAGSLIEFPLNRRISDENGLDKLSSILYQIHKNAGKIKAALGTKN